MSIADQFRHVIRRDLHRHPVWEPGLDIRPGSFGRFAGGFLRIEGHVSQYKVNPTTSTSKPEPYQFAADGTTSAHAVIGPVAAGQVVVEMPSAGSVCVVARESWVESIDELDAAVGAIRSAAPWVRRQLVVSVRHLAEGLVWVSSQGGSRAEFQVDQTLLPVAAGARWQAGGGYLRERVSGALLCEVATVWALRNVLRAAPNDGNDLGYAIVPGDRDPEDDPAD
jgi:hypothetical protein